MDYTVEGRSTGRGAFTDATVLLPGAGLTKEPDHREASRTGNHWTTRWNDLPEGTIIFNIDITNSGKEHRSIETLHGDELKLRACFEHGKWQRDDYGNANDLWRNFGP